MGNESNRHENDNTKTMKLAFGLNDRSSSRASARGSGDRIITNVFMDDDDSNHGDEASDHDEASDRAEGRGGAAPLSSSRSRVNRELRREQEALRRRAELRRQDGLPPRPLVGAASLGEPGRAPPGEADGSLYDYDGSYDSFKPSELPRSSDKDPLPPPPLTGGRRGGSKYVEDLLRAAELRQKEREARLEKKVAKEQAEEAAEDEALLGKDKFVTSAYKRKLQERELWQRDQLAKEAQEHEADVTRRSNASLAMSTFYSNLNRNVAMGGGNRDGEGDNDDNGRRGDGIDFRKRQESSDPEVRSGSFLDGSERPVGPTGDVGSLNRDPPDEGGAAAVGTDPSQPEERRKIRAHKLEQARARYFERHPDRRRREAAA